MKKIALLLVLMTTFLSCSIGDSDTYTNYVLPVDSYTLPEGTLEVGQIYPVKLKYDKPGDCFNYRGVYYYKVEGTKERLIGVLNDKKDGDTCSDDSTELTEVSFNFQPETAGTYTFKFYKGKDVDDADDDGDITEDLFEDVEIVVNEAS